MKPETQSPEGQESRKTKTEQNPAGAGLNLPRASAKAANDSVRGEKLSQLTLRFLNRLKSQARSPHTLAAYRNDLGLFGLFLLENQYPLDSFSTNLKEEWEHYLRSHGRNSPASLRRALMSVRTFLHFLVAEKVINSSPLLESKSPEQPKVSLLQCTSQQFEQLCETLQKQTQELLMGCSEDEKPLRDLVLVLALGECGLKATEATQMCWKDVHFNDTAQTGSLIVPGEKSRTVPFSQRSHFAFGNLKKVRAKLSLGTQLEDPVLFGYINVSRSVRSDKLHRHGVKFVVYELTEKVLGTPYNSESLRNHAILRWVEQGLSLQQVADLAGYSSLASLDRFETSESKKRNPRRKSRAPEPKAKGEATK